MTDDAFKGIDREQKWTSEPLTTEQLRKLCEPRPYRPKQPIPVSTETYERMARLLGVK